MTEITPDLLETAQERFGELQRCRQLVFERLPGAISIGRLYGYMQGLPDEGVDGALNTDLSVRRTYRELLQRSARVHIPQALAASTQEYPERHGDGCRLRLQPSRAQSDQLYLIIEMSDQRRDMPKSLNLFGVDETVARLNLPGARNGVIQTIIDKNSEIARLLGEPKTEIFLR